MPYLINFDRVHILHSGGLNLPFVEHQSKNNSLLDYMSNNKTKIPYYLRNFLQVSQQIFSALKYFQEKGYVHRDIKRKFHYTYILFNNYMYYIKLSFERLRENS